jgi:hypothetical protein
MSEPKLDTTPDTNGVEHPALDKGVGRLAHRQPRRRQRLAERDPLDDVARVTVEDSDPRGDNLPQSSSDPELTMPPPEIDVPFEDFRLEPVQEQLA